MLIFYLKVALISTMCGLIHRGITTAQDATMTGFHFAGGNAPSNVPVSKVATFTKGNR